MDLTEVAVGFVSAMIVIFNVFEIFNTSQNYWGYNSKKKKRLNTQYHSNFSSKTFKVRIFPLEGDIGLIFTIKSCRDKIS